jgi:hypothetical protein
MCRAVFQEVRFYLPKIFASEGIALVSSMRKAGYLSANPLIFHRKNGTIK